MDTINKTSIFISHASPEDDEFTRWLSLQLIGLGYTVWSDVIVLKGGEDWWKIIENEIRENSCKFLLVLSKSSNYKDGVLKELSVAQKVAKSISFPNFIIPLHIDEQLSYDDVNIELNRLNSINFKVSWSDGLKMLLEIFEKDGIPKSDTNHDNVKLLWENIFLGDNKVVEQEEDYVSNWFPISELPETLNFHKFKNRMPKRFDINQLPFPTVLYKDYLVTFAWCYDFIEQLPNTEKYSSSQTVKIPTELILDGVYDDKFITNRVAKNIIVKLLNSAFDNSIRDKAVSIYQMSNRISYWIKKGVLEKDKYEKVQLVGKQKDKNWHFGISGSAKMFPERCFVFTSHIWFTSDGNTLIEENSKQHSARRKQGRNWWNNDWREKTLAFAKYLAKENGIIELRLGSEELAKIDSSPILFHSTVKYNEPKKEYLPVDDSYQEYDELTDEGDIE